MTDTTIIAATVCLLFAGCSGGPTTSIDPMIRQSACMQETATGNAFMAGTDVASGASHALSSSGTPYAITLPAGADGYVGFHVSEIHTTIDVIVKHQSDLGAITKGGAMSEILFEQEAIAVGSSPAPSCNDLYIYRLHVDVPGDFELQLPSNAANQTWVLFQISQVGHDLP